jgi:spermidine synthase
MLWRGGVLRIVLVAALTASIAILVSRLGLTGRSMLALLGAPAFLIFSVSRRPLYFGAAVGAMAAAGVLYSGGYGTMIHRERTFFGVYRIIIDPTGRYRALYHGTTLHGSQSLDRTQSLEPLTYYHRTGPIGQFMGGFSNLHSKGHVGVIGLGTGSLAAYAMADQQWTFYEIDPAVARISANPRYFTYLMNASARSRIVLGDARLSLRNSSPHDYDLLVLDAFSSDAIPVHLLTREALEVYLGVLAEHGVIAFHISNRHLNLQPVLGRLADAKHLTALVRTDSATAETTKSGKLSSVWLLMARSRDDLLIPGADPRWVAPTTQAKGSLWTDDFSNIWSVFRSR